MSSIFGPFAALAAVAVAAAAAAAAAAASASAASASASPSLPPSSSTSAAAAAAGGVVHLSKSYADPQQGGHVVGVDLTYPVNISQRDVGSLPLVVFSHGLLGYPAGFVYLGDFLAREGFVFASLNDYDGVHVSNPFEYALDLAFLAQAVRADASLPFHKQLRPNATAVGGHSEGGAGTYVAASPKNYPKHHYDVPFNAAFTFSGCMTTDMPFVFDSVDNIEIPIMMLAGTRDCLCYEDLEKEIYKHLKSTTCRFFVDLVDGAHCNYMNAPEVQQLACQAADEFCHIGEHILSVKEQTGLVERFLLPWLHLQLLDGEGESLAQFEKLLEDNVASKTLTDLKYGGNCNATKPF